MTVSVSQAQGHPRLEQICHDQLLSIFSR